MAAFKDITGNVFGNLTAVGRHSKKYGRWQWLCRCACGNTKVLDINRLNMGNVKSCGCLWHKTSGTKTHGLSKTPEHQAWTAMRKRCNNTAGPDYRHYGGRGITVCERWDSFESFLADMGPRPSPQHSLERANNDGDYEPSNCRWATKTEQLQNQQKSIRLTWRGETLCLSEWARRLGLRYEGVRLRYHRGERPPSLFLAP